MTTQRRESATPAMASGNADDVAASIAAFLASKHVTPTRAWMHSFMPSIRLNAPLIALQKTALFRLLATDLTTSIQTSSVSLLPPDITNPQVKERSLQGPVMVQILDVEDIGQSRWSQVETIEAQERGETTRGREVIRVVPDESNPEAFAAHETKSSGPHKLLLQDANGTKVYAMELSTIAGLGVQMSVGTKLVLRSVNVARGVILLEPRSVEIIGGKVEAWDKTWRTERKRVLKEKAGMAEGG